MAKDLAVNSWSESLTEKAGKKDGYISEILKESSNFKLMD